MDALQNKGISQIKKEEWDVRRIAVLDEVVQVNGQIRFRVQVNDAGRTPFLSKWFNDPVPAMDFIERMKSEGELFVHDVED